MASFLTTSGTSNAIEEKLIIEAHERLDLLSPYLKLSRNLYERLRDADMRGVTIRIVCRKVDLDEGQKI